MSFDQRLERAIQRGKTSREARDRELAERRLSSEELKTRYAAGRIELSDRIESCLKQLGDHFPGFRFESILGDEGWGARVMRDDLQFQQGRGASNSYSRLELVIRPLGQQPIIELVAKGTIRNREVIQRRHYQQLEQLDLESFSELIDLWVLEYAEQYASQQ
ncbi:MAG: hypothetical protein R3B90_06215 [Planctomycetaceae bacterium]